MTHYPNSYCEKHKYVTTDEPICPVCLITTINAQAAEIERLHKELLERDAIWLPEKDAEIERLRAALAEIEEFPEGYWSGEANLDYAIAKRIGIARSAREASEPGYKSARGILPWKEGDEPAEDAIRKLRDGG